MTKRYVVLALAAACAAGALLARLAWAGAPRIHDKYFPAEFEVRQFAVDGPYAFYLGVDKATGQSYLLTYSPKDEYPTSVQRLVPKPLAELTKS